MGEEMTKIVLLILGIVFLVGVGIIINNEISEREMDKLFGCEIEGLEQKCSMIESSDIRLESSDFDMYEFYLCGTKIEPTEEIPEIGLFGFGNNIGIEPESGENIKFIHKVRTILFVEVIKDNETKNIEPNCAMVTEINLEELFKD